MEVKFWDEMNHDLMTFWMMDFKLPRLPNGWEPLGLESSIT